MPDRLCGYFAEKQNALPFGEGGTAPAVTGEVWHEFAPLRCNIGAKATDTSSVSPSGCHLPQRGRLLLRKSKFTDTNSPELSFRCVKKGSTGKGIAFSGGLAGARHKACDCLGAAGELEGERPAFPLDFQSHKTN